MCICFLNWKPAPAIVQSRWNGQAIVDDKSVYGFYHISVGDTPSQQEDAITIVQDQLRQMRERPLTFQGVEFEEVTDPREKSIPVSSLPVYTPKLFVTVASKDKVVKNKLSNIVHEAFKAKDKTQQPFQVEQVYETNGGQEDTTLMRLYDHCSEHPKAIVFYMHNLGAVESTKENDYFRQVVTDYIAGSKSRYCEAMVRTSRADTCGAKFWWYPHPQYPGNFWWGRCDYVRNLMQPQFLQMFYSFSKESLLPSEIGRDRSFFDHWVTAHPYVRISECMGHSLWVDGSPTESTINDTVNCRLMPEHHSIAHRNTKRINIRELEMRVWYSVDWGAPRHFRYDKALHYGKYHRYRYGDLNRPHGPNTTKAHYGYVFLEAQHKDWIQWDQERARRRWGPFQGG